MTSKPDSDSTLGYHWTDYTGTTLADVITKFYPNGNPVLIGIIRTHYKTTGTISTLECHWNHTGWCYHPVVSQWQSKVNLHNWAHTGYHKFLLQWHSGVRWGLTSMYTGLPLDYHWISTGSGQGCSTIPNVPIDIIIGWLITI